MERIDEAKSATLEEAVAREREYRHESEMASFTETGEEDQELIGIAVMGAGGEAAQAGSAEQRFPLESVSKALTLALALEDVGADALFERVGMEPSGDPYHSIATLEEGEMGIPSNPMINAGAIVTTAMIRGRDGEERFDRIRDYFRRLAGNPSLDYDRVMFEAEDKDLNRALFYYMRSHDVLKGSEEDLLVPYLKQTTIEVNCRELSRIAAVLANTGRDPESGERLIAEETVRIVLTLMFTTGMYDQSGRYAVEVGMPSKSGVSGAILAVAPERMGFGVIGPALNEHGNSVAGLRLLKVLSSRWRLGVFA
ncbi:glutaminase A [Billgrantia aerodenitrificans]|uniref:Glutaminase n=1 Tax=Billgrantia aerodenitrificans TaxID=2733483 RepID=A0ABS9AP99_9GAMM|nr:glutaminase A [Halomonas aerodenitrificans]MCE8023523.1 glutaminase A [Halomonas aerodenitrificans]